MIRYQFYQHLPEHEHIKENNSIIFCTENKTLHFHDFTYCVENRELIIHEKIMNALYEHLFGDVEVGFYCRETTPGPFDNIYEISISLPDFENGVDHEGVYIGSMNVSIHNVSKFLNDMDTQYEYKKLVFEQINDYIRSATVLMEIPVDEIRENIARTIILQDKLEQHLSEKNETIKKPKI